MKKVLFTLCICLLSCGWVSAQYLPTFEFGLKAGGTYSVFPSSTDYKTTGDPGYFGGIYARFGGLGFIFQPEMYMEKTTVTISDKQDIGTNKSSFTTFNVPLLFGKKVGDENLGIRYYTGPVLIFRLQNDQQFGNGGRINYQDQNYGWQLGGGIDLHPVAIDVRYEAGINKLSYGAPLNEHTSMNMLSLTISYSLFSSYSF
ncbi:outer membrane beta-barrel protein [Mucilaginibacter sp.]